MTPTGYYNIERMLKGLVVKRAQIVFLRSDASGIRLPSSVYFLRYSQSRRDGLCDSRCLLTVE
jgi:hypothetical protein